MENYMELKFLSKPENEAFARSTVAAFCVAMEPSLEQLNDIKTAVSEAVTNCIVHGYNSQKTGIIEIVVKTDGYTAEITVSDSGVGIEDVGRALEPFYTSKPNDERSGMGFTIMQSFMDNVEVISENGTTVRLVKKLKGQDNA